MALAGACCQLGRQVHYIVQGIHRAAYGHVAIAVIAVGVDGGGYAHGLRCWVAGAVVYACQYGRLAVDARVGVVKQVYGVGFGRAAAHPHDTAPHELLDVACPVVAVGVGKSIREWRGAEEHVVHRGDAVQAVVFIDVAHHDAATRTNGNLIDVEAIVAHELVVEVGGADLWIFRGARYLRRAEPAALIRMQPKAATSSTILKWCGRKGMELRHEQSLGASGSNGASARAGGTSPNYNFNT